MAGIGFRLKRLIAKETFGWLRAHLFGSVLSSGPWLLSIGTLATLAFLSRNVVGRPEHDLFRAIVVYSYTFSLIITGGVQMVVTRHLADELYLGYLGALKAIYRWTVAATALGHLVVACAFYGLAPDLPLTVRLSGIVLFVVVGCSWIAMIFLGAAQDYASVAAAFLGGSVLSVGAALGLGALWGLAGYLGGFVLGLAAFFFVLNARIEREFPATSTLQGLRLLGSFRRYPELALAGLLYNGAIAADRLIFWASPEGWRVTSWFYGSVYDTPVFLAYLSVVPSLAIFLVSAETDFYDRYRHYYGMVTKHGTLRQMLEAKAAMADSLRESLKRLLTVQVPVTLTLMAVAPWIVNAMGMQRIQIGILRATLVGALLHALTLFGIIVLLYFDRRRAALEVSGVLLAGNVLLTAASLQLGPRFYGVGYPLAALCSCAWAYWRLEGTLNDLEYLTFTSQPIAPKRQVPTGAR